MWNINCGRFCRPWHLKRSRDLVWRNLRERLRKRAPAWNLFLSVRCVYLFPYTALLEHFFKFILNKRHLKPTFLSFTQIKEFFNRCMPVKSTWFLFLNRSRVWTCKGQSRNHVIKHFAEMAIFFETLEITW